ncbi:hypothetical protein E8F12_08320 [Pseudomonas sp. BN102]|nr:hypothetical protein [Pseudomonas sp. BN102]
MVGHHQNDCIDVLWKVANAPQGSRLLTLAWMIECLRPDTPLPVLELPGEQDRNGFRRRLAEDQGHPAAGYRPGELPR